MGSVTTTVELVGTAPLFVTVSVLSTLVYGALLMYLAGRLYRREGLLG